MKIQHIIVGAKKDIPEKYLESTFQLMQEYEAKFFPFEPPKIEFYKKMWETSNLSWEYNLQAIGINNNDEVECSAWIGWNIKFDNLELAWFDIKLRENEDEQHNHLLMLKELVKHLPAQIKKVGFWYRKGSTKQAFYEQFKKEPSYEEYLYISNLSDQHLESVSIEAKKHKEKVHQKGYDIIYVKNQKYKENINYPKFVNLIECIWNDMPREELSEENAKMTVERYDELSTHNQKNWENFISFIAIEKQTNDPVGVTVSVIGDQQPHIAWQWETGVLKEFRGNGLGIALKYQMLEELLKSTKAKFWSTGSSSVNAHMQRINEALGYKKWTSEIVFEFPKEELQNLLMKM